MKLQHIFVFTWFAINRLIFKSFEIGKTIGVRSGIASRAAGNYESVSKTITGVEERMLHLEKAVDTKMDNLEKTVDRKLDMMEEKINNLQSQRPEPKQVAFESTSRIKAPCFDGSSLLSAFKLQFKTLARNG